MEAERARLEGMAMRLQHRFAIACTQRMARLDSLERQLLPAARKRLSNESHALEIMLQKLMPCIKMLLANKRNELACLEVRMHAADPKNILKKGYSITLHNGKALRSAKGLKPGDTLVTMLENGQIESAVSKTSLQEK